jgi:hypothetical protein
MRHDPFRRLRFPELQTLLSLGERASCPMRARLCAEGVRVQLARDASGKSPVWLIREPC